MLIFRSLDIQVAHLANRIGHDLLAFLGGVLAVAALMSAAFWWTGIAGSFLAMIALPALLIWATVILAIRACRAWRIRQVPRKAADVMLTSASILCLAPFTFVMAFWLVGGLFDWGTLVMKSPSYSHIIALSVQNKLPPRGINAFQVASDETLFEAEKHEPNRIAFPFPGGFLNNWSGVLYDPTGIGRRSNITQADGTHEDLLDDWWTIEKCTHMIGHYYSCGFS